MDVLRPRSLEQALHMRAARTDALVIRGGTDVMVDLNFRRVEPPALLDLSGVGDLGGWSPEGETVRIGAGVTYTEVVEGGLAAELPALAQAARTVGSPQIRNCGTVGGNLGTASPAGDALPPLLVGLGLVELASVRGVRQLPIADFLLGPKRSALADDELIAAVIVERARGEQTFMKVGTRNAMVIAVCSLAVAVDTERDEVRASFGSAGPVPGVVSVPLGDAEDLPAAVEEACSPIDDVRGTAAYRRHALGVLARRALKRCLV